MMYIANLFTGASVQGVYSTLDKAKAAVAAHFAIFGEAYDPALWKDSFGNDLQHVYPNSEHEMLTDVCILAYELDAPMEMA